MCDRSPFAHYYACIGSVSTCTDSEVTHTGFSGHRKGQQNTTRIRNFFAVGEGQGKILYVRIFGSRRTNPLKFGSGNIGYRRNVVYRHPPLNATGYVWLQIISEERLIIVPDPSLVLVLENYFCSQARGHGGA